MNSGSNQLVRDGMLTLQVAGSGLDDRGGRSDSNRQVFELVGAGPWDFLHRLGRPDAGLVDVGVVMPRGLLGKVSGHVVPPNGGRLTVKTALEVVGAWLGMRNCKFYWQINLLVWRCIRNRPPMPKVGDRLVLKVLPRVMLKSVGVFGLSEINLFPFPNENFC